MNSIIYRYIIVIVCAISLIFGVVSAFADEDEAEEILELDWKDLRPKKSVLWKAPIDDLSESEREALSDEELADLAAEQKLIMHSVAVDQKLNNRLISIAGNVIPLEYENGDITEFLLLPYFVTGDHAPLPPIHEIIFVSTDSGFILEKHLDTVRISGKLQAQYSAKLIHNHGQDVMIDVGYQMKKATVEDFIKP